MIVAGLHPLELQEHFPSKQVLKTLVSIVLKKS